MIWGGGVNKGGVGEEVGFYMVLEGVWVCNRERG